MSAHCTVTVDLSGVEAKLSADAIRAKQAVFAQRVGFDMNKYCPEDEGTLRDSMPTSSNFEAGQIIWNTPYAHRVLNLDHVRRVKNPNATPHWPDHAKSQHMNDWRQLAAQLITGEA